MFKWQNVQRKNPCHYPLLLTHCLPQTRKWHPCMPQQYACYAWIEKMKFRVNDRLQICKLSHLLICQHVTLHRQTHHTEGVFSSDEQSQMGRNWASDIPRCQSNCGRNQHSGPLWLIYRTLLLTHPAESLFRATHLQGRPQFTPSLKVSHAAWELA